MTPDIDVRLQSVIKAIEQVILPALDPHNPLAREQAALAIGHLHMIRGQLPYMADYMAICLADIVKLGGDLLVVADVRVAPGRAPVPGSLCFAAGPHDRRPAARERARCLAPHSGP